MLRATVIFSSTFRGSFLKDLLDLASRRMQDESVRLQLITPLNKSFKAKKSLIRVSYTHTASGSWWLILLMICLYAENKTVQLFFCFPAIGPPCVCKEMFWLVTMHVFLCLEREKEHKTNQETKYLTFIAPCHYINVCCNSQGLVSKNDLWTEVSRSLPEEDQL